MALTVAPSTTSQVTRTRRASRDRTHMKVRSTLSRRALGALAVTMALVGASGVASAAGSHTMTTDTDPVQVGRAPLAQRHHGDQRGRGPRLRAAGHRRDQRRGRRARQADRADRRGRRVRRPTSSPRRSRSCSPTTRWRPCSAAGPRPAARRCCRCSRASTACCSTRCSTRASRSRRTSSTPAPRPTSRSSRRSTTSKEQGLTKVFLVGSDYVFPRTANKIIKAYAEANGLEIVGEEYLPLGDTERADHGPEGRSTPSRRSCSTRSTATATWRSSRSSRPRATRRTRSRRSRCRSPRKRSAASALENIEGHLSPGTTTRPPTTRRTTTFVAAFKAEVRRRTGSHRRPDRGRLQLGLHLGGRGREGRLVRRRRIKEAAKGLELDTPEGPSRSATGTSTSSRRPASARSTPTA